MNNDNEHRMSELIMGFVSKAGKQQLYSERVIMNQWPEYVGEMCAKYSQCVDFTKGVMHVKVTNAALRFELNGRKSMIMDRINADYGIKVVKDIIFI